MGSGHSGSPLGVHWEQVVQISDWRALELCGMLSHLLHYLFADEETDRKGLAQEYLSQSELEAVLGPRPCTPGSQLLQFLKLSTFSNGHPG